MDRSVLAQGAVEQGHHDDRSGRCRGAEHRSGRHFATGGFESRRKFVRSAVEGGHGSLGEVPLPVAIDADGDDRVPPSIDGPQNVGGRDATDVVLGGLSAEDDDQRRARGLG